MPPSAVPLLTPNPLRHKPEGHRDSDPDTFDQENAQSPKGNEFTDTNGRDRDWSPREEIACRIEWREKGNA